MNLALITHKVVKGEGQARVNYEIARRAVERGWRVTLVAGQIAPELQACPQMTWVHIPWSDRFSELAGIWNFARRSARWLRKRRAAFDVIHVNGFVTWECSDVNAVHFVHSAWRQSPWHPCRVRPQPGARNLSNLLRPPDVHSAYQWLFSALNAHWEQQAFRQTRQLVAVSQRVRQELLALGVSPDKIQVIGNGVDLEEFYPARNQDVRDGMQGSEDWARAKAAERGAWNLPPDVPMGLFAGDLRLMRKNLDTVLRALTRLPYLHLAVAGKVEDSPYPALAARLGVSARVHFPGFCADMPALMRACDFLAFPSRYEPFGLVVLEALASGLPVLTATSAGGAEIVTPNCGYVLMDAENDAELADVVQTWLEHPERLRQMRVAARRIAQEHGWSRMADAYLRLYSEIAATKAQAASCVTVPVRGKAVSP